MVLLIFDIDGTLVYSNRKDSRTFAESYQQQFGKPFPSINWHDYPHVTDTTIFNQVYQQQFGRVVNPTEVEGFKQAYTEALRLKRLRHPGHYREVPFAAHTLKLLQQRKDIVVGIATGGWRLPALLKLKHAGFEADSWIQSFADEKITREDIIQGVLDEAGRQDVNFRRVVYVGDATWDVQTTRRLNMNFVGIRVQGDVDYLLKQGVRHVFPHYQQFDRFMKAVLEEACPPS